MLLALSDELNIVCYVSNDYVCADKIKHYVGTKDKDDYRKPTKSSPLFGLDCEMVEVRFTVNNIGL